MRFTDSSRAVRLTTEPASRLDVDVLVVPVFEKEPSPDIGGLEEATAGQLRMAIERGEFTGKPYTVFLAPVAAAAWRPLRVMLVGLGPRDRYVVDRARKWATAAGLAARDRKLCRVALLLPGVLPGTVEVQALAEGVTLAAFYAGTYKNDPTAIPSILEPQLVASPGIDSLALGDLERAALKGSILGASSNFARALTNEPANSMTPRAFVEAADQSIDSLHSFMLLRHGHVVAEGWWAPYHAQAPHSLYSLSKSFTSTAAGLAIAEGKLRLDDEALKFFPEEAPAEPDKNLKAMRMCTRLKSKSAD
jgi:leucyl aminopeptidase